MMSKNLDADECIEITWKIALDSDTITAVRFVAARALSAAARGLMLHFDRLTRLDSSGDHAIVYPHRRQADRDSHLNVIEFSRQPKALARLIRLNIPQDLDSAAPQHDRRSGTLTRLIGAQLSCHSVATQARTMRLAFAIFAAAGTVSAQTVNAPIVTRGTLDPSLVETVAKELPESKNVDKQFLNPAYEPTLRLSQSAQVFVTFVDEGAGYQNALGYFSYAEGALDGRSKADIDANSDGVVSLKEADAIGLDIGWVFPDATRAPGRLTPGDSVALGDGVVLDAGVHIGFFLVQNGWDGGGVDGWTNNLSPQTFYTLDFLNPEASADMTLASSGVGKTRHVAMLFEDTAKQQIIMGFEDLNRANARANEFRYSSDEDFNDAVFVIRSNPVEALAETNIATAPGPLAGSTIAALVALTLLFRRRRS